MDSGSKDLVKEVTNDYLEELPNYDNVDLSDWSGLGGRGPRWMRVTENGTLVDENVIDGEAIFSEVEKEGPLLLDSEGLKKV